MLTLAQPQTHRTEIKKSRFIARAERLDAAADAAGLIAELGEADATHNCWAYRVGDSYRFSDDGEPGGTAGRPILAAIDGQGIDHVLVVVTRYYGGIKLGAGGLSRAYGGSAAECLRVAARLEVRPRTTLDVAVPFELIGAVYPVLEQLGATKLAERFDDAGATITVEIDAADREAFEGALGDATRGRGRALDVPAIRRRG